MGIFDRRFEESTRGRVVGLLRRGPQTVDELALALGLTDNGVRMHLAALERDGMIHRSGSRRGEGAGKPAALYELTAEAEARFSRAYPPVLGAVMEELVEELPAERGRAMLASVGRRLASGVMLPAGASFEERLLAAVDTLVGLGASVTIEEREGVRVIRGSACPLSETVARRPETCLVVEALLAEISGRPVRQCCLHGKRPRCCFEVPVAA